MGSTRGEEREERRGLREAMAVCVCVVGEWHRVCSPRLFLEIGDLGIGDWDWGFGVWRPRNRGG